jgi:uncharacterized membrane protein YfcA
MGLGLWLLVIAGGAVGQFVDTVAGMGFGAFSGSFMIAGGVLPAVVVATVNLAKIGSGLFSGAAHWRFGNIHWSWVVPLAVSGVLGGVVGALLLTHLPSDISRFWVPGLLLIMGLLLLRRFLFVALEVPRVAGASQEWTAPAPATLWEKVAYRWSGASAAIQLAAIGVMGGILNGVSGAYGPFTTSSVLLARGGHPRYAIGSVNLAEFFVAGAVAFTILTQIDWGEFQWQLPLALIIGSIVTAPIGAYLSKHLPARLLGILVGVALIGVNVSSIVRGVL